MELSLLGMSVPWLIGIAILIIAFFLAALSLNYQALALL
jgi:membrane-bound ClpP family serine protease